MSTRLGTRVVAGVFGFGLLLGSVASATAALPGALLGAGTAHSQRGAVSTPSAASGATGQVAHGLGGSLAAADQAAQSAASQASDRVGPKLASALSDPPVPAASGASAASGRGGDSSGPLGAVTGKLPAVGALAPVTGTVDQGRKLLGPAVGALLNDTPLSTSGGTGFDPLTNTVGTSVGGLSANSGTVTRGVTKLVGGQ